LITLVSRRGDRQYFQTRNEVDIPPSRQEAYLLPLSFRVMSLVGGDTMSFGVLTLNLWNINEPLDTRYGALETGLKRLRISFACRKSVAIQNPDGVSRSSLQKCAATRTSWKTVAWRLCAQFPLSDRPTSHCLSSRETFRRRCYRWNC